ncbi:MAG: phosphate signaling complex protein PhoU [Candidatus Omnitrophica bacterium]|nr:phosphate signaling complex protein PhoU [Candidatus Omnitrophota bacterium]
MERHFDAQLKELKTDLLRMAALTEEAIYKAVEALTSLDAGLAHSVINHDGEIDELELKIEEDAIRMLALRQPLAADLRFITTGMKINSELERIADLAENIAECGLNVLSQPMLKPLIDIPKLSTIARRMVRDSIEAFVNSDENLARTVILADPEADRLRDAIYDELVNGFISKDGSCAPRAVPLLLIARHLERICDHATYIAEDIIYMVQAKVVKHHPEMLNEQGEGPAA